MPFDENAGMRVATIIEQRAPWIANSVRKNSRAAAEQNKVRYGLPESGEVTPQLELARKEILLQDLDRIYHRSPSDIRLIEKYADEFIPVARNTMGNGPAFPLAASAASVLQRLEGSPQLGMMVNRYIKNGSPDHQLYDLCICFDQEQTALEPKFVNALKAQLANPSCGDQFRITFAEQLARVDPSLIESVHWTIARDSTKGNMRSDSIAWLVSHTGKPEAFKIAMEYLAEPGAQKEYYYCIEVVDAILNSKPFQDDEIAFADEIAGSLQLTARKHTECLGSLVRSKNRVFAPLFRELAQAAESKEQLRLAVAGVQLTCPPTEFQDLLESAFANSKHASVIYNLHKSEKGIEKTLNTIRSRWESEKKHWMLDLVCLHTPVNQGADLKQMLEVGFERTLKSDSDQYRFVVVRQQFQILSFMKKFGFDDLAVRTASRIPDIKDYWFEDSAEANVFVVGFNKQFELAKRLTVPDVFEADSKADWQLGEKSGQFQIDLFKAATMNAAGMGRIIDPEHWGTDGGLFAAIAELGGDKFHVEAHDMVADNRVRLLVNDLVYEFEMSDDWSWYYSEPACDVLNTILECQKFEERFFVFQEAYGNSYVRLVMFAKPSQVRAFVRDNPDFKIVDGCQKYWEQ